MRNHASVCRQEHFSKFRVKKPCSIRYNRGMENEVVKTPKELKKEKKERQKLKRAEDRKRKMLKFHARHGQEEDFFYRFMKNFQMNEKTALQTLEELDVKVPRYMVAFAKEKKRRIKENRRQRKEALKRRERERKEEDWLFEQWIAFCEEEKVEEEIEEELAQETSFENLIWMGDEYFFSIDEAYLEGEEILEEFFKDDQEVFLMSEELFDENQEERKLLWS